MSHLTLEQRYIISSMLQSGSTQTSIAEVLGKDKSVISRELKRNSDGRSSKYRPELAHRKATKRLVNKPKHIAFTDDMKTCVSSKIKEKLSPEQFAGEAKLKGIAMVSHERIYRQYIPKRTDFDEITEEFVSLVEAELNNRPRKRFNFQTPTEVFNQKVAFVT